MKTTPEHFEIFKQECEKWIEIFGLKDWKIEFRHEEHLDNTTASLWASSVDRLAVIYLDPDWKHQEITPEALDLSAFHEVCELLIAPLTICAKARYVSEDEIMEGGHYIVRTLENVLYPKY